MTPTPKPAPSDAHALIERLIAQGFDDLPTQDGHCDWTDIAKLRDELLGSVSRSLATIPAAEPVAWRWRWKAYPQDWLITDYDPRKNVADRVAGVTPLYASPQPARETDAARDVLAERQRQIDAEGWTPEHEDAHGNGEMGLAAAVYAMFGVGRYSDQWLFQHVWPWELSWWKPKDRRSNLVRAGALILADIERLDRANLRARCQP